MPQPREANRPSWLSNRYLRAVLASAVFAQLGIWIRNFAVLLYVMERSGGDAGAVALVSVAEYAPLFLFSIIGGVFADRWRPRRTIVLCEWLSAGSVLGVWIALRAGDWHAIFLAALVSAILSQFSQPAGMKLFKRHVPEAEMAVGMAAIQTIFAVFMIAGPALGTFAYARFGIGAALVITASAFALSAISLAAVPRDDASAGGHSPADSPAGDPSRLSTQFADGFRYLLKSRVLSLLSLSFAVVGLGVGLIQPLGAFLVTERLGLPLGALQWITIPYGAGELIGGFLVMKLAMKIAPQRLLALGLLVNAVGIAATGLSTTLWLCMAGQFAIALLQPAIFAGNAALTMQHTEERMIGRVTGIRTPLLTGAMLTMMSLAGTLKAHMPLALMYVSAALLFVIALGVIAPLWRSSAPSPSASNAASHR
ncbi:MFS transporter [Cohnella nanjingensis]|uniref:MFS transporter n=1 Tax=Cohnella nanjingensis TaxID=1387779 RepID=A0A7X0RMH4_9BACL|nr:MFS transporter [Cohnella nanjingensis]MBB6670190.1 MFS transporter [Cohnella nanjingensis]